MNKRAMAAVSAAAIAMAAVFTAAPLSALAAAPTSESVAYKGRGRVEVEFASEVDYKKPVVAVTDDAGKKYKAVVIDKDDDDMMFRIIGYKADKTYSFTLSGIREEGTTDYGSLKGTVAIPAVSAKPEIKSIDYDREDRELEVKFVSRVNWRNVKVTLQKENGKKITSRIIKKDSDEVNIRAKLTVGATYKITVSGVKKSAAASFTAVSKTFTVTKD